MARRAKFPIVSLAGGLFALASCTAPAPQLGDAGPAIPASTQALMGSTPQVLSTDFGAPALRRVDGTAQVWLYHSAVCGLDVFLYPDANGVPRVAAAVPDNGDPIRCMQSLAHPGLTAAALEPPAAS
ncbi:hypothetical protein [Acidocella sp. KAb 2-4]|uniref:hypothetical protein n=1 Tax=Acidocella sp. KAb 2-4 TaxID=2885158 RepID=UPI001D08150A|nr:hypothetical protein [Acidocella sp. KAb 2-4]MCB5946081.1 hypothetical protein [Acidocella sp. KAb 2-4]